ncbi:hypothetical protein [Treponema zioleckii]|uniref:hypothetical protein n=1 Tax=Treponema zioleckii TaxID=331680 RepID=UPI00168AFD29|nr:hypothetical protein [Treponema zioleckii]
MKKLILIFTMIFALSAVFLQNIFAHDEPKANVVILLENGKSCLEIAKTRIPEPDDVSAPINTEYADALKSIDKKIKAAKEIPLGKAEKACIDEGVYTIEYLDDGRKYSVQNDFWLYESKSKKFFRCHILNELRLLKQIKEHSDFYEKYYSQKTLSKTDSDDIDFIKWLFTKETEIPLEDQNIEAIKNDYSGGIPVTVTQLPVCYKVGISKAEFKQLKKQLKKKSEWKTDNGKIRFLLITKFDCACVINQDEIIFGFGNLDIIQP